MKCKEQKAEGIKPGLCRGEDRAGTILICDDDYAVRTLARTMFEYRGYAVFEAGTGEEALTILVAESITALIIDVELPGMSGVDVCRVVRKNESWSNMPIIVISGYEEKHYIEAVYSSGANVFQKKPVPWIMLPSTVAALTMAVQLPTVVAKEAVDLSVLTKDTLMQGVLEPIQSVGSLLSTFGGKADSPTGASMVMYGAAIAALKEAERTLKICLGEASSSSEEAAPCHTLKLIEKDVSAALDSTFKSQGEVSSSDPL